jgi:hypothetical protein
LEGWLPSQTLKRIEAGVVDQRFWLRSGSGPKDIFSCGEAEEVGIANSRSRVEQVRETKRKELLGMD